MTRRENTDAIYLLPVFEVLKARCNAIDGIYGDYRWQTVTTESELHSLILTIKSILDCRDKFEHIEVSGDSNGSYDGKVDLAVLQFQIYSFFGQLMMMMENYDEASNCYRISCEMAIKLFGGAEGSDYSYAVFSTVQEQHRRMLANLKLGRDGDAKEIYKDVKRILTSVPREDSQFAERGFFNFHELWDKFGYSDIAKEALELGGQNYVIDMEIEHQQYLEDEEAGLIPTIEEAWQGSINQYLARFEPEPEE